MFQWDTPEGEFHKRYCFCDADASEEQVRILCSRIMSRIKVSIVALAISANMSLSFLSQCKKLCADPPLPPGPGNTTGPFYGDPKDGCRSDERPEEVPLWKCLCIQFVMQSGFVNLNFTHITTFDRLAMRTARPTRFAAPDALRRVRRLWSPISSPRQRLNGPFPHQASSAKRRARMHPLGAQPR